MYGWRTIRALLLEAMASLSKVEDLAKVEDALQELYKLHEVLDLEDINMRKDLAYVLMSSAYLHRLPVEGRKAVLSEVWPQDWKTPRGRSTVNMWLGSRRHMSTRRLLRLACLRLWRFYQRERMIRELLFCLEEEWEGLSRYTQNAVAKIRDYNAKYPAAVGVYPKERWRTPASIKKLMEECKHGEDLAAELADREPADYKEIAQDIEEQLQGENEEE